MATISKIKPYKGAALTKTVNNAIAKLNDILVYNTYGNQKIYISESPKPQNVSIYLDRGNIVNLYVDADINITLNNYTPGETYYIILDQWNIAYNVVISWINTNIKWAGGAAFSNMSFQIGDINMVVLYYDGTNFYGSFALNGAPYE